METTEIKNITWRDIRDLFKLLFQDELIELFDMSKRDVMIVKMMWEQGKDFKEIADKFGFSEPGIIRIYDSAIHRYRYKISEAAVAFKEHREVLDENLKLREEVQFLKKRFYRLDAKAKKKFSPAYEEILNPVYQTPILNFDLSARVLNGLTLANINTIGDIMELSRKELLHIKNFGEQSLHEIETFLKEEFGLELKK
jgi:hypothetical protein